MTVRLAEIAERAGVSVASVSRVLNDKPGVAPSTREAVLIALDVLGYERPARLRPKVDGLVGLIVPELDNPFFPRLVQVVETALGQHRLTPLLCSRSLGSMHEDDYVAMLLERGVTGIVFVSGVHAVEGTDPSRYIALVERGLPIVLVNGYLPGVEATFVSNDDATAVDLAVSHLAHLGHRRIGLAVGQDRYVPVRRRIAAFHEALRRHVDEDLTDDAIGGLVASTVYSVEGGEAAAHALLEQEVTAIVCASDLMALGAVRGVRRQGLSVPLDVSVVGSDDSALIEFTDPPLTTVRQPVQAMGAAAVEALVDQIEGHPARPGELVFGPELVVRGSTARAPARTPVGLHT